MLVVLRLVLGSLLVSTGLALVVVAVLGARGRLPRNRLAGVRTAATLRSDAAFRLGNRVAAPLLGAAGVVGAGGGSAVLAGAHATATWVVLALTAAGTLVLVGVAGVLGDRVAATVPDESAPVCSGTCAGCDLVAGCRDASVGG